MKAIVCRGFDGPEALELAEVSEPRPAPDEILVDVHVAPVSYMDYLLVSGRYQMRPPTPFVPGTESAGTVAAVGEAVTRFEPGDHVACVHWYGGYAERVVTSQWSAVRIPPGVDFAPAATLHYAYGSARYALVARAGLQPGETLFVTGAAGALGLAAVEIGTILGGRVIAGIGSDDKAEIVRDRGASEVINYRRTELRERIRELTGGAGVDVCFENLGGSIFQEMTRLMTWGGRLMPIGFTSGQIPSVPMNLPLLKNYSIVGVFWGAWNDRYRIESAGAQELLMEWLADRKIRPHIAELLPLEAAREAMHAIAQRRAGGRIALTLNPG